MPGAVLIEQQLFGKRLFSKLQTKYGSLES